MSLVTRCPACDTTFKVVRDQLRISDGWVRCGRCSEVFDATVELRETPDPGVPASPAAAASAPDEGDAEAPPQPPVASVVEPPAAIDEPTEAASEMADVAEEDFLDDEPLPEEPLAGVLLPIDAEVAPHPFAPGPVSAPATWQAAAGGIATDPAWPDANLLELGDEGRSAVRPPAPPPLAFPDIDLSMPAPLSVAPPSDAEAESVAGEDTANAPLQKALRRARVKSAKIARAKAREEKAAAASAGPAPVVLAASEAEPQPEAARGLPSFMAAASGPEGGIWRRPGVRRSMVVVAILAALLLAGQVVHQQRDLIAARQPGLRAALASMCRVLGCELSALRQIDDIKIDGASFSREKGDDGGFLLSFTLRNTAEVPLAMPAVQLSLLDTQERAVVRRVLMPSDFGAPAVLAAKAERAASLSLKLTGAEAAALPPVAGFSVEALYP